MEKQSAVEWLVDKVFCKHTCKWKGVIEQAKEMEKEQIMNAYNTSFRLRDKPYQTAEKYYQETYKQD